VEGIHLVYLGLLPALATFSVLVVYGHSAPFLLFIGGVVAVSVYLAVVASYTRPARSLGVALLILLDGPLWVVLSRSTGRAPFSLEMVTSPAIEGFLVDGIAIWFVIVWLAVSTARPSRYQRVATIGFALVAVVSILFTFWPYIRENVWGEWVRLAWLALGTMETVVARHYLLKADEVVRDTMPSAIYILIFLFVWFVAFCVGNIAHEMQWFAF
jgi:hypothetical protein